MYRVMQKETLKTSFKELTVLILFSLSCCFAFFPRGCGYITDLSATTTANLAVCNWWCVMSYFLAIIIVAENTALQSSENPP